MTIGKYFTYQTITVTTKYQPGVDDGESNKVDITDAKLVVIKAVGAGGSGGGGGTAGDAGCGGGSGGYAEVYLTTSHIASYTNLVISLGTGGASKTGQNHGSVGGNTTVHFDSSPDVLIVTCNGGNGGLHGNYYGGYGGTGGTATISVGLGYTIKGYPGKHGYDQGTVVPYYDGGYGGNSKLGPGGMGAVYDSTGTDVTDAVAGVRGGGGGGGADGTDGASGAGGNGCVIITIYK